MTYYLDMHDVISIPCDSLSTTWAPSAIAVPLYLVLVVELAREIRVGVA